MHFFCLLLRISKDHQRRKNKRKAFLHIYTLLVTWLLCHFFFWIFTIFHFVTSSCCANSCHSLLLVFSLNFILVRKKMVTKIHNGPMTSIKLIKRMVIPKNYYQLSFTFTYKWMKNHLVIFFSSNPIFCLLLCCYTNFFIKKIYLKTLSTTINIVTSQIFI